MFDDIMLLINSEGCSLDGKKASAEARLHTSLYSHCPAVQALSHLHSSTLASRLFRDVLETDRLARHLGRKIAGTRVGSDAGGAFHAAKV